MHSKMLQWMFPRCFEGLSRIAQRLSKQLMPSGQLQTHRLPRSMTRVKSFDRSHAAMNPLPKFAEVQTISSVCLWRRSRRFPSQPMIAFNLACYACQLGRLEEAREWLRKAMDLGDEKEIKTRALDDPDLEPLWANIGKLGPA